MPGLTLVADPVDRKPGPVEVLAGDLTRDVKLSLCLKVISLAMDLGASPGLPLALGVAARNRFVLAKTWGRQGRDCTAILPLLQGAAGAHRTPE